MRERAEMAGGWTKLWSLPGQGTTLDVWLPDEESDQSRLAIEDVGGMVAEVVPLPDRGERAFETRVANSDGRRSSEG